jgi:hypothetical protein
MHMPAQKEASSCTCLASTTAFFQAGLPTVSSRQTQSRILIALCPVLVPSSPPPGASGRETPPGQITNCPLAQ